MNCANHPELPAIAYCRMCGKALCESCRRLAGGTIYCAEHAPRAGHGRSDSGPIALHVAADCSPLPAIAERLPDWLSCWA